MSFLTTHKEKLDSLVEKASVVKSLPLLRRWSPAPPVLPSAEVCQGFLKSQRLAMHACREVAGFMEPGWTEKQAANMINTYLQDHGVDSFFHYAFAWFGDRTQFTNVKTYGDFSPTQRVLQEHDVFILDVAPIVQGYVSDVGYAGQMGNDEEFAAIQQFLRDLHKNIPSMVNNAAPGKDLWHAVDRAIANAGYTNIHKRYPFAVLGHRVHEVPKEGPDPQLLNFGWKSYWSLLSRGLFGQLLNEQAAGDVRGLWAIEPHISNGKFGAKFEEILIIDDQGARWLEADRSKGSLD